jgi:ribosomal protein L11 methylase PrmA
LASYPALDVRYAPAPDADVLQDLLYAELDPFEPLAIEESGDGWRVFFRLSSHRDHAHAALASAFGERLLALSPVEVDDEDWARRSQAALTAIRVGRIVVAPPWDVPLNRDSAGGIRDSGSETRDSGGGIRDSRDPNPEHPSPDITIVIEPSMGFGTGHHATTRLCLELLQTMDLSGLRVIDVGTGSGVLALAASMLGASRVTAMDNDPDALQNARENIARNSSPPNADTHLYGKSLTGKVHQIEVIEVDLSAVSGYQADVVVANLTGAVLQRYAATLRRMADPAGVLIVSGFSPDEMDDVVGAIGMPLSDSRRDGEWAAAVMTDRAART